MQELEYRYLPEAEVTVEAKRFCGYAAIFNSLSRDLGGFLEVIRPGAFRNALSKGKEIYACIDHDRSKLLGLLSNRTLTLREDDRGLYFEVEVPDTTYGRDALEQGKRGFFKGCSFAFMPRTSKGEFRREGGKVVHELREIDCFDVSVVFEPAYPATSVYLRSFEEWKRNDEETSRAAAMLIDHKLRWLKRARDLWN